MIRESCPVAFQPVRIPRAAPDWQAGSELAWFAPQFILVLHLARCSGMRVWGMAPHVYAGCGSACAFPGGALIGCSAGFVNVPRIKGNHNAMLTGIMAAEATVDALEQDREGDVLTAYEEAYERSPVRRELQKARNFKPLWSKFGTWVGALGAGAVDMWTNAIIPGFSLFGTLKHGKTDAAATEPADQHKMVSYPKPDGKLTFDRLTNVSFSATNHEEDQPAHLKLKDASIPIGVNLPNYDEPAQRYCPAGVYEVLSNDDGSDPRFQINAQNCVHCKTCDIKDPSQNIIWTVPEGGGGPNYPNM